MSTTIVPLPTELLVYDRLSPCPYLPERVARLPLRLPVRRLSRPEMDERLTAGDRRQGVLLYRATCPSCSACVPLWVDASAFRPSRIFRRVQRRARRTVRVEVGPPIADARRVQLYNLHKRGRGLGDGQPPIDAEGYRDFLVETCCDSFELRYYLGQELIGVALTDRGADSLSAVYCFFDPAYESLSLGTFSILEQISFCQKSRLRWLYLGLYIQECRAMGYKTRFYPQERLMNGHWRRFENRPT